MLAIRAGSQSDMPVTPPTLSPKHTPGQSHQRQWLLPCTRPRHLISPHARPEVPDVSYLPSSSIFPSTKREDIHCRDRLTRSSLSIHKHYLTHRDVLLRHSSSLATTAIQPRRYRLITFRCVDSSHSSLQTPSLSVRSGVCVLQLLVLVTNKHHCHS